MTEGRAGHVELERIVAEMESEHRQIGAMLDRLRHTHGAEDLAAQLAELHTMLSSHFAHEQYPGGFYEALGACSASFRDDLRVLVDQHFHIVTTVYGLRERARRATGNAPELDLEVAGLVDQLRQHEAKEHAMVEKLAV